VNSKLADHQLVLTYYGDDFTGPTDVMESLTTNGLPTVLFLNPPTDAEVARFPGYRAVGVAGISRSQPPSWMEQNLPPIFERLKELGAPVCHYKICSTFDSSPETGSIGKALDLGQEVFGNPYVPLVVGAPVLRRYTIFGNLFATVDGVTHRLDRHPTMMHHPVTPMRESDLRLHLREQTSKAIELIDILALQSADLEQRFDAVLERKPEVLLFDILDQWSLIETGRLLWERRAAEQVFMVGSSGLEYALVAYWQSTGELKAATEPTEPGPADRIAVVSGSCSPTTEKQIRWALANGFEGIALNASELVSGLEGEAALHDSTQRALAALSTGRSVVLYTALGSNGPMQVEVERRDATGFNTRLGQQLGRILKELVRRVDLRRAMACGGDTSGHAGQQLGVNALTMIRPLAPGGPLCRAWSSDPAFDGKDIVFKGGQVGGERYFGWVRAGRPDS
jgi:3-oxoisoapionate kinase